MADQGITRQIVCRFERFVAPGREIVSRRFIITDRWRTIPETFLDIFAIENYARERFLSMWTDAESASEYPLFVM